MIPPLSLQHRKHSSALWLFGFGGFRWWTTWASCFRAPPKMNPNSKCSSQEETSSISACKATGITVKSSGSMFWTWCCWFRGSGRATSSADIWRFSFSVFQWCNQSVTDVLLRFARYFEKCLVLHPALYESWLCYTTYRLREKFI